VVGLTVNAPLVASVPVQPPLAAQDVAFVLDHARVEPLPAAIVVGFAVRATLGAATGETTVTVAVALLVG